MQKQCGSIGRASTKHKTNKFACSGKAVDRKPGGHRKPGAAGAGTMVGTGAPMSCVSSSSSRELQEKWALWKEKHQCPLESRIFIVNALKAPWLRDALLARGWFQNTDAKSAIFDLKWDACPNRICYSNLLEHQVVNRIENSRDVFATKTSLTHSLKGCREHCGVFSDLFYPRAFDMQCPVDRLRFVVDFRRSKAEAVLANFIHQSTSEVELVPGGKRAQSYSDKVVEAAIKLCLNWTIWASKLSSQGGFAPEPGRGDVDYDACWELVQKTSLDDAIAVEIAHPAERKFEEIAITGFEKSLIPNKRRLLVACPQSNSIASCQRRSLLQLRSPPSESASASVNMSASAHGSHNTTAIVEHTDSTQQNHPPSVSAPDDTPLLIAVAGAAAAATQPRTRTQMQTQTNRQSQTTESQSGATTAAAAAAAATTKATTATTTGHAEAVRVNWPSQHKAQNKQVRLQWESS
mmetsp:Transcript_50755/g.107683  ORF Transcript_50755/g.107683 Transcript_50755/m.107683 type:complete len:464 (+) Transcript_50755:668-2059(+)